MLMVLIYFIKNTVVAIECYNSYPQINKLNDFNDIGLIVKMPLNSYVNDIISHKNKVI